jgi:hypothetical protein
MSPTGFTLHYGLQPRPIRFGFSRLREVLLDANTVQHPELGNVLCLFQCELRECGSEVGWTFHHVAQGGVSKVEKKAVINVWIDDGHGCLHGLMLRKVVGWGQQE